MGDVIRIPCDTEARINAYRDLKAGNLTPAKREAAIVLLADSPDWKDRETARQERQAQAQEAMERDLTDADSIEQAREIAGYYGAEMQIIGRPLKPQPVITAESNGPPSFGFWATFLSGIVVGGIVLGEWVQSLWITLP
jgi:hypothetical protein